VSATRSRTTPTRSTRSPRRRAHRLAAGPRGLGALLRNRINSNLRDAAGRVAGRLSRFSARSTPWCLAWSQVPSCSPVPDQLHGDSELGGRSHAIPPFRFRRAWSARACQRRSPRRTGAPGEAVLAGGWRHRLSFSAARPGICFEITRRIFGARPQSSCVCSRPAVVDDTSPARRGAAARSTRTRPRLIGVVAHRH